MRFKLDENVPRRARDRLESRGWDVQDVHQEGLASAFDRPIQEACEREDRILVTLDMDFADTRRYDPGRSPGVIVLRPLTINQSVPSFSVSTARSGRWRRNQFAPLSGSWNLNASEFAIIPRAPDALHKEGRS